LFNIDNLIMNIMDLFYVPVNITSVACIINILILNHGKWKFKVLKLKVTRKIILNINLKN